MLQLRSRQEADERQPRCRLGQTRKSGPAPAASGLRAEADGAHYFRIEVLRDLGESEVECMVSTDDEAFTYNKRIVSDPGAANDRQSDRAQRPQG